MPSTALKPKHPGGRPTAYRPEFGEMIIEAMATGLSAEAAAAKIGISAVKADRSADGARQDCGNHATKRCAFRLLRRCSNLANVPLIWPRTQ
jgi:hypothetical protein